MKTDIHPKYFDHIEIRCACGNVVFSGSTKETLKTELCSACHPFYTGKQKLVDTAGRVDKFEARRKAGQLHREAVASKAREQKVKKTAVAVKKPALRKGGINAAPTTKKIMTAKKPAKKKTLKKK